MYQDWMELVPLDVQPNKNCNNNANKEEEEWILPFSREPGHFQNWHSVGYIWKTGTLKNHQTTISS